jgi:hypothetical protein
MLVVDIMHEFLLGIWKGIFTSILRLIHATNPQQTAELNRRYSDSSFVLLPNSHRICSFRELGSFGKSVRRFTQNVSDLKHMTASKWEVILKVSIPFIEDGRIRAV